MAVDEYGWNNRVEGGEERGEEAIKEKKKKRRGLCGREQMRMRDRWRERREDSLHT